MNFFSQLFAPIPQLDSLAAQAKLKAQPKPFLLDVREPDEYRDGHIAGAKLVPLGELTQRLGELPRDREIICVCRSGNRSGTATRQLVAAGYTAVNLSGGMIGWAQKNLPIKKGNGA